MCAVEKDSDLLLRNGLRAKRLCFEENRIEVPETTGSHTAFCRFLRNENRFEFSEHLDFFLKRNGRFV